MSTELGDHWGVVKWLRLRVLDPACGGSNPPAPANMQVQVSGIKKDER